MEFGVSVMAGKLKNCPRCGRLFMDLGSKICEVCIEKEHEDEDRAAEYVREHPNAHVKEIAKETGVKETIIMRMVRQGRFTSSSGVTITYPCERCGKPITNGRLCDMCNRALITEVKQQQEQQQRLQHLRKDAPKPAAAPKKPAAASPSRGGMYSKNMV